MACRWTVGALMVLLHVSSAGAQPCAHNPVIQNVSAILGIQGTVLDSSGNLGGTPVPGPQQILSLPNSDPRRETITLVVGSTVLLNISASWGSQYQNQNLSLYAYEDPGVPNGAVLSTQECLGNFGACNPVLRQFSWAPRLGQAGMTHSMCFLALPKPALSGASLTQCQSPFKCVDLRVVAPELTWVRPGTPLPKQEYHSPVGCHLELCFEAYDASSLYTVDVTPVDAKLPPGASFDTECATVPQSASQLSLFPNVDLLAVAVTATPPVVYAPGRCRRCMRWEAPRGSETQEYSPCFTARDTHSLRAVETCVLIKVPKCKYCVQGGDTLHFINKRYRLNSNWLQLWNANGIGEIASDPLAPATVFGDPDAISNGFSIVNLGPVYSVKKGEDLVNLAYLFRTTVKKLLDVNPDIASPEALHEGMDLCVMPCTDAPFIYNDNPTGI